MNWFEQGPWSNFWSDAQKQMASQWPAAGMPAGMPLGNGMPFGAAIPGGGPAGMPFAGAMPFAANMPFAKMFGGAATAAGAPGGAAEGAASAAGSPFGFDKVNDLVKQALEGWTAFMQTAGGKQGAGADNEMLARLFDPSQWGKVMAGGQDLSLERLTEGPTYATVTDIDRKIIRAQQLWLQRARDIEGYRQVVQAAWLRAFEQMRKALADPKGPPLESARAVLDLWLSIANEALLEMHHRPEYLESQRKMTRSAAEYRLQEQELAEVFCTLHHIPTRTEMDEAQKIIVELRRELRALKRRVDETPRAKVVNEVVNEVVNKVVNKVSEKAGAKVGEKARTPARAPSRRSRA